MLRVYPVQLMKTVFRKRDAPVLLPFHIRNDNYNIPKQASTNTGAFQLYVGRRQSSTTSKSKAAQKRESLGQPV